MTSEAHHLNSPPPAVSVKARAKAIEARSQAAGKSLSLTSRPPVAPAEVANKRYQLGSHLDPEASPGVHQSLSPSRRCSEGDLFQPSKVPPPLAPKQRRVSLEHTPLPAVPERRSAPLARLQECGEAGAACQAETTASKFARPAGGGGKSSVTCHSQATADFSPAIFSSSLLAAASGTKRSPLDDIITALEKICDEFDLPDDPQADQSAQHGRDEVFERRGDVRDPGPSDGLQRNGGEPARKPLDVPGSTPPKPSAFQEPVVYRSVVHFAPRTPAQHVVSATLQVSPPNIPPRRDLEAASSQSDRISFGNALRFNNTAVVPERSDGRKSTPKREISDKNPSVGKGTSFPLVSRELTAVKNTKNDRLNQVQNAVGHESGSVKSNTATKDDLPSVPSKPDVPVITTPCESSADRETDGSEKQDSAAICPSEELEIVKNILANLDFQKYKRRYSLDSMEEKPPRVQKTSSVKLKDLFDLLKPSSETSGSSRKPFALCRSSSFTNAECMVSDTRPNTLFPQSEETDQVKPLPDESKKMVTLPRRKTSKEQFMKISLPLPVQAVSSCPSIVKLESPEVSAIHDPTESDLAHDEGLVSDSEVGSGAYVTAYVSCLSTSPSAHSDRRGHVRSSSDNVTFSPTAPEVRIKKTNSTEKLWTSVTSRLNGSDKRKRRKGIGCKQSDGTNLQEPVKSGTGRSLTYPPQRKSSTSEEEQEFTSVDSNGLKSLKTLTAGLADSGPDVVRLLSDLSLADSHLCLSEGTVDETYLDVVDSVMHSPCDSQHLSVEDHTSGGKPHKKKHHSDPGGEASSSSPADGFVPDPIGSSVSEPDLGGNEIIPPSSSSCSSASPETLSRATQTNHDEKHPQLKLIIDIKKGQTSKHVRTSSLTSGAQPLSRFPFPDADAGSQRLAIDQSLSSKSPQEQRRYSKRRLRGPYGEMLEEEMRKSGEKQKPAYNDLSFLQDLCDTKANAPTTENASSQTQTSRPTMFLSSQSLDDASSTSLKNDLAMCVTPKRKVSANYPLLTDGETVAIASDEDLSPIKPQTPNEPAVTNARESNSDAKKSRPKPKTDSKGLSEAEKEYERSLDTRTHVVGELYDTEKSYVESLQILANVLPVLCKA